MHCPNLLFVEYAKLHSSVIPHGGLLFFLEMDFFSPTLQAMFLFQYHLRLRFKFAYVAHRFAKPS